MYMIDIKKHLGMNLCILLFVAFIAVLVYTIYNRRDLISIQDNKEKENFEYYANSKPSFTMYYADWCPHCVDAKPHFKKLMGSSWKGKVALKMVDCEKEPELAKREKIEGYPTIKFVKNGEESIFEGPRTYAGFESFLQKNL